MKKRESVVKRIWLPLVLLLVFVLLAGWVAVGRFAFGVGGWLFVFSVLFAVPIILIYAILVSLVILVRQLKSDYRVGPFFLWSIGTVIVSLFVAGLTMVDFGDSEESVGSILSALLGNQSGEATVAFSGILFGFSVVTILISSIVALIAAFAEKSRKISTVEPETPQRTTDI